MIGAALLGVAAAQLLPPAPRLPTALVETGVPAVDHVRFGHCRGRTGGADCVIDGDTFRIGGETVRIADIDTPETHPPRCAAEAALGRQATERLRELLNAGPVTLVPADRDVDR